MNNYQPEDLIFSVNYLVGSMPTFALNFSRPGGQVIAQYYNFVRLGREGYTKLHSSCYRTAQYLAREIAALGPFEMIFGGEPASLIKVLLILGLVGCVVGLKLVDGSH